MPVSAAPRPRLLISAPASGCGKTSACLGLMGALKARGFVVQPCKAGPDYIDAALHTAACGRPSATYDPRLMGAANALALFERRALGADLVVIEGAMGYYDGSAAGRTSAYDAAKALDAPVMLVLDARAAAESLAATALGFIRYKRRSGIRGFILNRVGSQRHAEAAKKAVERATGLPVWGALPKDVRIGIPERHLGLALPAHNPAFADALRAMAEAWERHVDLDAVVSAAGAAKRLARPRSVAAGLLSGESPKRMGRFRLAVAYDQAFSFYYQDNFDILSSLGAELAFFSPLKDRALPEGCAGLYLGGGYPELHAAELSSNVEMLEAVASAIKKGMPTLAECGGYLYLCRSLTDAAGLQYPLVGAVPWGARMTGERQALGYYEGLCLGRGALTRYGERLKGHCFHWSVAEGQSDRAAAIELSKDGVRGEPDGYAEGVLFATYLHQHFAGNLRFARRFAAACQAHRLRAGLEGS